MHYVLRAVVISAVSLTTFGSIHAQTPSPSPPVATGSVSAADKSTAAEAASRTEAEPAPAPDFWRQETLTGDWGGARSRWKEKGIELEFKYVGIFQSLASGGTGEHSSLSNKFETTWKFDLAKVAGWKFWSSEIKAEWRFGGPALIGTGGINFTNTSGIIPGASGSVVSVTAVNFTRIIPRDLKKGDVFVISFGRYNLLDLIEEDFFGGGGVDRFMNIAPIGPLTVLRQVPLITNAFTFATVKGGEPRFSIAVMDPNDQSLDPGIDTLFADGVTFSPGYNGTRGAGVGAKLYLKKDLYRVTVAAGRARVNYDFYGAGIIAGNAGRFIPLTSRGTAFFGEMLRRVKGKIYVGGRVQYRNLAIAIRPQEGDSEGRPVIDDAEFHARTVALGLKTTHDTRDDSFYPTTGSLFNFTGDFFDQAWGSRFEYQVYKTDFNRYITMTPRQVFAYRAMGCFANGRVPFYDLCLYGAMNDLRGYTAGRYQDRRMFATQAEYRVELPKRFGLVAFGGFGGVARHFNEFRMDQLLPAAGAGARFRLTKESHINFRVDIAVGRNSHTVTVGVGEAF